MSNAFRVALTFDVEHPDRPNRPNVTESILDTLSRTGVRATTFIQGRWAEAYPELTRRIAADGHLVGNHSHYHVRMPLLTRAGMATDVTSATQAIVDACGVDPRPWFRCPFGVSDRGTRVSGVLARLGYRDVNWHVSSVDWEARSGAEVEKTVLDGVAAHGDGSIVLLHGWPPATADGLPSLIERLVERGASFVTVDQLTDVPAAAVYPVGA
jgi:peptidoglycan/xylan/chitin deacetylase (PgdA/CDA1 family)